MIIIYIIKVNQKKYIQYNLMKQISNNIYINMYIVIGKCNLNSKYLINMINLRDNIFIF